MPIIRVSAHFDSLALLKEQVLKLSCSQNWVYTEACWGGKGFHSENSALKIIQQVSISDRLRKHKQNGVFRNINIFNMQNLAHLFEIQLLKIV